MGYTRDSTASMILSCIGAGKVSLPLSEAWDNIAELGGYNRPRLYLISS